MNAIAPGQSFGDYEIVDVAGTGGMGVVYRARQKSLDRVVALKVIRPQIADEPEFRERFVREARSASAIDHPHVVTIYDAGEIDNRLFLAMQWLEGEDLHDLIAAGGPLAPPRAREITTQLAAAIDAVHEAGLLHRDVKPANVLVRRVSGKDHAYLMDFGIARQSEADGLTKTGLSVGTPGFAAPEQMRGEMPTAASDLYALACVAFQLFTGRSPFSGENAMALQWANANDPRPVASEFNSDLDDRYDDFFVRALAIDPAERFSSGSEFGANLERAQARQPLTISGGAGSTAVGPLTHPATVVDKSMPDGAQVSRGATPVTVSGSAERASDANSGARSRGGSFAAIIGLGLIAAVGLTVGVLAASGMFSDDEAVAERELVAAKKAAAAQEKKADAAEEKLRAARAKARREKEKSEKAQSSSAAVTSRAVMDFTLETHYGDGYRVDLPIGSEWGDVLASEPTPGRLFESRVDASNGMFVLAHYTPYEKAQFGNSASSQSSVNGTIWDPATEYVFSGGSISGCGTCVDLIFNESSSGPGFGVVAGGGTLAQIKSLARSVAASAAPE